MSACYNRFVRWRAAGWCVGPDIGSDHRGARRRVQMIDSTANPGFWRGELKKATRIAVWAGQGRTDHQGSRAGRWPGPAVGVDLDAGTGGRLPPPQGCSTVYAEHHPAGRPRPMTPIGCAGASRTQVPRPTSRRNPTGNGRRASAPSSIANAIVSSVSSTEIKHFRRIATRYELTRQTISLSSSSPLPKSGCAKMSHRVIRGCFPRTSADHYWLVKTERGSHGTLCRIGFVDGNDAFVRR